MQQSFVQKINFLNFYVAVQNGLKYNSFFLGLFPSWRSLEAPHVFKPENFKVTLQFFFLKNEHGIVLLNVKRRTLGLLLS